MSETNGQLLHNLILFGRLLRDLGMDVNPGRMIDVVNALEYISIGRRADFYYTLQALLVNRRDDLPLFEQAFNLFWRKPGDGSIELNLGDLLQKRSQPPTLIMPPLPEDDATPQAFDQNSDDEEMQEIIEVTRTFSTRELLHHKDFGDLTPEELIAMRQLMAQLVWRLGERRTRRQQPGRGWRLDLRRTLRRNFRYGGEQLEWANLTPRIKPRPLVIIADISGSMERYTRLLIQFLYSLAAGLDQRVEVFVFSTRLTRITRQLRRRDVDRALREVSQTVPDWSGGTRIGDALKAFNFTWGRRVLRGGALVLLISDGWDRGDPALLRQEMARLQRTSRRLVWLNPLLGSPRYEPLTRGIQAALPYIDDFLPVHNLASLEDLAAHLAQLDEKRAAHRQPIRISGAAFVGRR